jgi:hypothetical protein
MNPGRIRRSMRHFAGVLVALASVPLCAQTHKATAPQHVVRAVGVYEWIGDMAKPTASRLIPVSLFIDDKLEDAAVYLARPEPFALLTGNVYELQKSGLALGALNLAFARHMVPALMETASYDDGWFGYGVFVSPAALKASTLRPSKTPAVINEFDDDNDPSPHFSSRSATPGSGGAATPLPGQQSDTAADAPANDPDRPVMKRHDDSSQTASAGTAGSGSTGNTSAGGAPADDPDRPTLRRHSAAPDSADTKNPDIASTGNALNDDPNRPLLHRGKAIDRMTEQDIPKLTGLPGDTELHQLVAVSDAVDHPPHDFTRPWDDEAEHQAILAKMQAAAHAELAKYEAANSATKAPGMTQDTRRINSKLRRGVAKETPPPPPEPLLDEQLKGYTLSYGGAATFVYYAQTDGLGAQQRFVTLVAQVNMQSEPEIALKSVTDADHLDRTPRMRLVDVVDAEASNRASLLFELRAQSSRQFALYRVIGARAEQTYITGSTQ